MIREQRHAQILASIRRDKLVIIQDLSQQLGVSYMTISRDLDELERQGHLHRIRGGAVPVRDDHEPGAYLAQLYDPTQDLHFRQKAAIARYAAAELVEEGDTITIEAGSTARSMLQHLTQPNLTILTNGLIASMLAAPRVRELTLICSGGILIDTGAFIGPQAEDFFAAYKVKKAFFGAMGLTLQDGFTDLTPLYTRLKEAMKASAEKVIMLVDSSKFGVRALIQVMPLADVDVIVTDWEAPAEMVAALRARGIDVRIAPE